MSKERGCPVETSEALLEELLLWVGDSIKSRRLNVGNGALKLLATEVVKKLPSKKETIVRKPSAAQCSHDQSIVDQGHLDLIVSEPFSTHSWHLRKAQSRGRLGIN